jgi:hypothetical protein
MSWFLCNLVQIVGIAFVGHLLQPYRLFFCIFRLQINLSQLLTCASDDKFYSCHRSSSPKFVNWVPLCCCSKAKTGEDFIAFYLQIDELFHQQNRAFSFLCFFCSCTDLYLPKYRSVHSGSSSMLVFVHLCLSIVCLSTEH